jgi:excisionase family DNA binding protein
MSKISTLAGRERMLRIGDVAKRLDCSEATVRRLIQNGQLRAGQFNGKHTSVRIAESVLEDWLAEHFVRESFGDEAA